MQRAYNAGAFASLAAAAAAGAPPASVPFRVASLGGGPGFELLAVQAFCAEHLPAAAVQLTSLDLEESWRPCAEGLGLGFAPWDVQDGEGLLGACGWPRVDLAIISCAALCPTTTRATPIGVHGHPWASSDVDGTGMACAGTCSTTTCVAAISTHPQTAGP